MCVIVANYLGVTSCEVIGKCLGRSRWSSNWTDKNNKNIFTVDEQDKKPTGHGLGVFRKPVRRTLYILSQTAKN